MFSSLVKISRTLSGKFSDMVLFIFVPPGVLFFGCFIVCFISCGVTWCVLWNRCRYLDCQGCLVDWVVFELCYW